MKSPSLNSHIRLPSNLLALYNGIESPWIGPTMARHTISPLLVLVELDSCMAIPQWLQEMAQVSDNSAICTVHNWLDISPSQGDATNDITQQSHN